MVRMDGSYGRTETEALLDRLHNGGPAGLVGLEPADAGPVPSRQQILEWATDASADAQLPRERAEALLHALRAENARLRSQIMATATASVTNSVTASQSRAPSSEVHVDKAEHPIRL